jgi:hypothetical protein
VHPHQLLKTPFSHMVCKQDVSRGSLGDDDTVNIITSNTYAPVDADLRKPMAPPL